MNGQLAQPEAFEISSTPQSSLTTSMTSSSSSSFSAAPWSPQEDEALTQLINYIAHHRDLDPVRIPFHTIEEFRTSSNLLPHRNTDQIQARYAAICVLNKAGAVALPFVDFSTGDNRVPLVSTTLPRFNPFPEHYSQALSPSGRVYAPLKRVIFTHTKMNLWALTLRETTTPTAEPPDLLDKPDDLKELSINRIEARNARRIKSSLGFQQRLRSSVLGQLMDAMKGWDDRSLRRAFVHAQDAGQSRAFFVKLVGEGGDDNGGPYRAVFMDAIGEEAVDLLGLVRGEGFDDDYDASPSNASNDFSPSGPSGPHTSTGGTSHWSDKMELSQSLFTPTHLPLYTFLGKLMGMACRHGILAPLSLADSIWKPMTSESLTTEDLLSVDKSLVDTLFNFDRGMSGYDGDLIVQASFRAAGSRAVEHFVKCHLQTDDDTDVTSNKKSEICELLKQRRLTRHAVGMQHLLKGMASVIPTELLAMFTPLEADELFCGHPHLDLEVLKKATVYEDVSPTARHIKLFWDCMEGMSQEERAKFVNFCSGRSRLPSAAEAFPMKFKLQGPPPQSQENPDRYLPKAQTCFFSLSLPEYTSLEVCREKLLYAISNTELIDADFTIRNAQGWENIHN